VSHQRIDQGASTLLIRVTSTLLIRLTSGGHFETPRISERSFSNFALSRSLISSFAVALYGLFLSIKPLVGRAFFL